MDLKQVQIGDLVQFGEVTHCYDLSGKIGLYLGKDKIIYSRNGHEVTNHLVHIIGQDHITTLNATMLQFLEIYKKKERKKNNV